MSINMNIFQVVRNWFNRRAIREDYTKSILAVLYRRGRPIGHLYNRRVKERWVVTVGSRAEMVQIFIRMCGSLTIEKQTIGGYSFYRCRLPMKNSFIEMHHKTRPSNGEFGNILICIPRTDLTVKELLFIEKQS